jgi:methyl acetate hydrolase
LLRYHQATGEPNPLSGLKRSLSVPLVNDPGTAWEYGVNTDWLGLIVEKLSGQTLSGYLKQKVSKRAADGLGCFVARGLGR